jgi:hypothetical protein
LLEQDCQDRAAEAVLFDVEEDTTSQTDTEDKDSPVLASGLLFIDVRELIELDLARVRKQSRLHESHRSRHVHQVERQEDARNRHQVKHLNMGEKSYARDDRVEFLLMSSDQRFIIAPFLERHLTG